MSVVVYVVEVWNRKAEAWVPEERGGSLSVYLRRNAADMRRRALRGDGWRARVTPAVLS